MLDKIKALPRAALAGAATLMFLVVLGLAWNGGGPTAEGHDDEAATGPHGGRLLVEGEYAIELTIFERGVPPQFRAYATRQGKAVDLARIELEVELTRLGGRVDRFAFEPVEDYLLAAGVVEEPHSFDVVVRARFDGSPLEWRYASYEGRTVIAPTAAAQAGITTVQASPAALTETIPLYGLVKPDAERVRRISARYPGLVREVSARVGDAVRKGEVLATVENNESLQVYSIRAPIDGVVVERNANPGESVAEGVLFTLADVSSVWIELQVFHRDVGRVKRGQEVRIGDFEGEAADTGRVVYVAPVGAPASQSVLARVLVPNADAHLAPGLYVTGEVVVARNAVPLAVPLSALQTFRDRTVVFEQVGDTYEVRMVELGRRDAERVEVLAGLAAGAVVVTGNSYLVKADIEKSGASHDH
jgi:cobalt-zinc-cadmium efflux system membrane fusion protein